MNPIHCHQAGVFLLPLHTVKCLFPRRAACDRPTCPDQEGGRPTDQCRCQMYYAQGNILFSSPLWLLARHLRFLPVSPFDFCRSEKSLTPSVSEHSTWDIYHLTPGKRKGWGWREGKNRTFKAPSHNQRPQAVSLFLLFSPSSLVLLILSPLFMPFLHYLCNRLGPAVDGDGTISVPLT